MCAYHIARHDTACNFVRVPLQFNGTGAVPVSVNAQTSLLTAFSAELPSLINSNVSGALLVRQRRCTPSCDSD